MITHSLTGTVLMTAATGAINQPVAIELVWDEETDPFAVQMIISRVEGVDEDDQEDVVWFFARELMYQGVAAGGIFSAGKGDVKFKTEPQHARLVVCLSNPSGHADLGLPLADVTRFLDATFKVIPLGEEAADEDELDELIKEILG
jgi:sporulation and cell division protein SsgA